MVGLFYSVILSETLTLLITFEQWVLELWYFTWVFLVIRLFRGFILKNIKAFILHMSIFPTGIKIFVLVTLTVFGIGHYRGHLCFKNTSCFYYMYRQVKCSTFRSIHFNQIEQKWRKKTHLVLSNKLFHQEKLGKGIHTKRKLLKFMWKILSLFQSCWSQ
mgnify:CR=1 FL=1